MGCIGFGKPSSASYPDRSSSTTVTVVHKHEHVNISPPVPKLPNPDPKNWKIIQSHQYGEYLLVKINYPDCTNYEGNKILLYEGITVNQLILQRFIDPHFSNHTFYKSPIARFEPTETGWTLGQFLALHLKNLKD